MNQRYFDHLNKYCIIHTQTKKTKKLWRKRNKRTFLHEIDIDIKDKSVKCYKSFALQFNLIHNLLVFFSYFLFSFLFMLMLIS